MSEQLKKIGVEAQVIQMEWGQLVRECSPANNYDFDMYITAHTFFPDPDSYLYPYYHSKGNLNPGYKNAKMDELLDKGRTTMDRNQRLAIYKEAQQLCVQECPYIYWYAGANIEAVQDNVKGYVQSFTGRRIFFNKTWLG
jgi:ABC-type transport system substrate-binding protein